MRAVVRLIDTILRKWGRIYEFSDDPECILRIQLMSANHTVLIGGERIMRDELVLGIHVWNEHMPKLPKAGVDLEWALRIRRQVVYSFKEIAKVMQHDSRYTQVRAVCATSALF